MKVSDFVLNAVAISALFSRIRVLYAVIKQKEFSKVKFEMLIILLIVGIWSLFFFKFL